MVKVPYTIKRTVKNKHDTIKDVSFVVKIEPYKLEKVGNVIVVILKRNRAYWI